MAFQGNFNGKFSTRILKRLEKPIKEIAYDIGVSYKTLWNWINGLSTFPPDLIHKLYEVTKDKRIFDFFLHPAGFVALEDPDGKLRELIENAIKALKDLIANKRADEKDNPAIVVDEYGNTIAEGMLRDFRRLMG